MILSFKQKLPDNTPTGFVEKILEDIKIHTLREDPNGRWKGGNSIQMATGVRTKYYNQFNIDRPDLQKCISVQKVGLYPDLQIIVIDNRGLTNDEIELFAIRDGFDSVDKFWQWFTKTQQLKLIHWTKLKY